MVLLSLLLGIVSIWSFLGTCVGMYELAYGSKDGSPVGRTARATALCAVVSLGAAYLSGVVWRL